MYHPELEHLFHMVELKRFDRWFSEMLCLTENKSASNVNSSLIVLKLQQTS